MNAGRSIAKTVLLLLPLQIVFRGLEGLLPVVLAIWFGRRESTDVYYFAWAVFALAGSLVFSAFHDSAVVPILGEVKLRDPVSLPIVRGSLLAHTLAIASALSVTIGTLAAGWLAIRYTGAARVAALWMTVPFAFYLVALSVKTFFASILNAEHLYGPLPVASALGALTTLAAIAALRQLLSVVAIPCGSLAGELVSVGVLAASARSRGIAIVPTFARPEPVRRIARLVASEVAGGAVTRLNPVVDQLMAALAGVTGAGTMLKLSGDVAMVPTSLLQAALLPVLLSHLSEYFAAGHIAKLRSTVRRALTSVIVILVASSGLIWAVRLPLLRFIFAHGAMDAAGIDRMARILPYHLLGVAPFGALLVLARAHVAAQNSRIMLSMGILNAGVNAGLNLVFLSVLGLEGLALSTSCTYAVVAVVFAVRLESRLATTSTASPAAEILP